MMDLQERRLTLEGLVSVVDEVEPYVLTLEDAEASLDGAKEAKTLVVMKRPAGVLLAVPAGFIADELLEQGNGGADGLFGPSVDITVPGVVLDNGVVSPTGTMVNAVLVDCSAQILEFLRLPSMFEEIASTFDADDPFALPAGDALVAAALDWIPQVVGLAEFYTAESSAPRTPVSKRKASRPGGGKATPSGVPGVTKQKRPTTASLAENIEVLMQTIPGLNFQMQELVERQNMMEQRLALPTSGHRGTLSQPLGASFEGRLASLGCLAATAKAPPKTADRQQLGEAERGDGTCRGEAASGRYPGACCVGAVPSPPNIDWSDLSIDFGPHGRLRIGRWCRDSWLGGSCPSSTGVSCSEGCLLRCGCSKHGQENVANITPRSRSPSPTFSRSFRHPLPRKIRGLREAEGTWLPDVSDHDGVRFPDEWKWSCFPGRFGFAGCHGGADGDGQWENRGCQSFGATRRPASIDLYKSSGVATSRSRSFAPLADQRWITVALAYLREMDLIANKRLEFAGGGKASLGGSEEVPTPKPKGAPKKKGRGKGANQSVEEEAG